MWQMENLEMLQVKAVVFERAPFKSFPRLIDLGHLFKIEPVFDSADVIED